MITTIFLWSVCCSQPAFLLCSLSADKKEYLFGEPVWISFRLINNQSDIIFIDHLNLPTAMELVDQNGAKIKKKYSDWRVSTPLLHPGDTLSWKTNITSTHGHIMHDKDIYFDVLPLGKYTVKFAIPTRRNKSGFANIDTIFSNIESYEIKSNQIRFEIMEPKDIEKDAFLLMNLAAKSHSKKCDNLIEELGYLDRLVEHHPYSAYRDAAYSTICFILEWCHQQDLVLKYARKSFDANPNSYFADQIIYYCEKSFRYFKNPGKARRFFKKIISKCPGTQAAVEASWQLDRVNKLPKDKWINILKLTPKDRAFYGID